MSFLLRLAVVSVGLTWEFSGCSRSEIQPCRRTPLTSQGRLSTWSSPQAQGSRARRVARRDGERPSAHLSARGDRGPRWRSETRATDGSEPRLSQRSISRPFGSSEAVSRTGRSIRSTSMSSPSRRTVPTRKGVRSHGEAKPAGRPPMTFGRSTELTSGSFRLPQRPSRFTIGAAAGWLFSMTRSPSW